MNGLKVFLLSCVVAISQSVFGGVVCQQSNEIEQPKRFVFQLYSDVLNRDPDQNGFADKIAEILSNKENVCSQLVSATAQHECDWKFRAKMAYGFLTSDEYIRAKNINLRYHHEEFALALYKHFFRRKPDIETGINPLVARLKSKATTQEQEVYGLFMSNEYRNRFPCCQGGATIDQLEPFIESVYRDILNREPELPATVKEVAYGKDGSGGLNKKLQSLCAGLTSEKYFACKWEKVFSPYAYAVMHSEESRTRLSNLYSSGYLNTKEGFVQTSYLSLFRRSMDGSVKPSSLADGEAAKLKYFTDLIGNNEYRQRFRWRANSWYNTCRRPDINRSLNFPAGSFFLNLGASEKINGVKIELNSEGVFQIVNMSTNVVLWPSAYDSAKPPVCKDSKCHVYFQKDGNLVLRGPTGVLWSSKTGDSHGTLIFSSSESYLSIKNLAYKTIWSTGRPTRGLEQESKFHQLALYQSTSTSSFLNMLGVGTHIDQGKNSSDELDSQLTYLGIKTIRANLTSDNPGSNEQMQELADKGYKFNLINSSSRFDWLIPTYENFVRKNPYSVVSVEGPNEINNWSIRCGSSYFSNESFDNELLAGVPLAGSAPAGQVARCYMNSLYSGVKSSAILRHLPVYNLTGGEMAANAKKYGLLGNGVKNADFGNIHVYPRSKDRVYQPREWLLGALAASSLSPKAPQTVVTETGYSTGSGASVTPSTQAILTLNTLFDAYDVGFSKVFLYTMTDDEEDFGLFAKPNGAPILDTAKPVAHAIHNLTKILSDAGLKARSTDTSLRHSITGLAEKSFSLLLRRKDGAFFIIFWNENPAVPSNSDIAGSPQTVRVNFADENKNVKIYIPSRRNGSAPVRQLNAKSVEVKLGAEPIILEVAP